jgi:hypothetical protein
MNNTRLLIISLIIIGLGLLNIFFSTIPNLSPIAAMALFGGVYLKNRKIALLVPILALFISDLFLGFHSSMWAVYGSFTLVVILGTLIKKVNFINIFSAAIASSLLFFIITNFAVWTQGSFYPMSFSGLVECYTMGIPFFKNTIIGDLLFSGVIFGGFTIAQTKFSILKEITIPVENK